MSKLTQPIKYHGGKGYLAAKIVALMPPHQHYIEPYAGGLSVLLAKGPEGVSEVVNDLNQDLTCFWSAMQNVGLFESFRRMVEATPFSEIEFEAAKVFFDRQLTASSFAATGLTDQEMSKLVTRAVNFFILCRQSLAGRQKSFAGLTTTRTRRGMNEQVSAWLTAVEGLPAVHARLKRVLILNRPAVEVIHKYDGPDAMFYLDPPYLHETRATTADYQFEMDEMQHRELLATVTNETRKGKFMLSGYQSKVYGEFLGGWKCHTFELPNNAAGGDSKRRMTECLWCNF